MSRDKFERLTCKQGTYKNVGCCSICGTKTSDGRLCGECAASGDLRSFVEEVKRSHRLS